MITRKVIHDVAVMVVGHPSQHVPTELYGDSNTAIAVPDKQEIVYLANAIERLLDAFSILLSLKLNKSQSEVRKLLCLDQKSTIAGLVWLGLLGSLEKNVKNFCAYPMARLLGEELPPQKDGVNYCFLLGRKVRRLINSRTPQGRNGKSVRKESVVFSNSLLCLKDCMVDVPDSFIQKSFEDYYTTLSTPPPDDQEVFRKWKEGRVEKVMEEEGRSEASGPESARQEFDAIRDRISESIRMTVNEVFHAVHPSKYRDDDVVPSCSSSYESKRKDGGAWNHLVESEFGEFHGISPNLDLLTAAYHPSHGVRFVYGKMCPITGEYVESGRTVRARVSPVLEPCKVRWISIGESSAYYKAKSWNRLVYSQMPEHPTFVLTGRPMKESDLNQMNQRYVLSGDYKGATDTLDPSYSEEVLEAITSRIYSRDQGEGWARRYMGLKAMLTGHQLEYKDKDGVSHHFEQKTGQLMGSYLSFPILCILNAAVNRVFLDPELKVKLSDLPMLINGDDIMMSSGECFPGWTEHVAMVGLKPSVGKNYVHTHVCCLNSEFYRRSSVKDFFRRQYPIRLNLIYNKDSDADEGLFGNHVNRPAHLQLCTTGAKARTLVEGQSPGITSKLISLFIDRNRKLLGSSQRNWFIPEELGGIGLPLTNETIQKVTPLGRLVATYLMTRPKPEDVLLYAPRGSPSSSEACKQWMRACEEVLPRQGYHFGWLGVDDKTPPPPIRLQDFIGYSSIPEQGGYQSRYRALVKEVLRAKKFLTPCSDEALFEFSAHPRRAGWIPPSTTVTWEDLKQSQAQIELVANSSNLASLVLIEDEFGIIENCN